MKPAPSLFRVRLAMVLLGAALVVGLGLLLQRGLESTAREQTYRHQAVAERIFDEMERELSALVAAEEARPFLHWSHYYVSDTQVAENTGLSRSPLATPPEDLHLVGYFQINPDGEFVTPLRPALPASGKEPATDPKIAALERELRGVTDRLGLASPSPREDAPLVSSGVNESEQPRQDPVPVDFRMQQALNTGAAQRAERTSKRVSTGSTQFSSFAGAGSTDRSALDVVISPLEARADEHNVLLSRSVSIAGRDWIQGLALRRRLLEKHLKENVAADEDVGPYVTIGWRQTKEEATAGAYLFSHRFAEPFDALETTLTLAALPGTGSGSRNWLLAVSAIVAAVGIAGLAAIYRMTTTSLRYAQQRNDFVSAVTHELRSPLTTIRMYSEMLDQGIVEDGKRKEYYRIMRAEAERLNRLVEDVLTFGRLERGTPSADGETAEVKRVLDDVLEVLEPQAIAAGLDLAVDVSGEAAAVRVDRDALVRIMTNLLDNAIKFSTEGSRNSVEIKADLFEGELSLEVHDGGPGVPDALIPHIFEPFVRGENELTRKTGGTGIGLALVDGLVRDLDGRVEARNHPRGGLEVTVVLPAGADSAPV